MKKVILLFILSLAGLHESSSQNTIKNLDGYSPQVGALVNMMDDLKKRVTRHVQTLSQRETDFLLDEQANRIGAIILHLAATEVYYQKATFYQTQFGDSDQEWITAMYLGQKGRDELKGKPISYYLKKWDEVRAETKRILKTKDDEWLLKPRDDWGNVDYNYYWAWYHVMEHQANHMGQIALIKRRIKL